MAYKENDLIIGKVIGVKPYALFMSFEDGSNGLLHISELSDSFIRDIEKFGSLGDELKVKVLSIDEKNGFLRVSYKKVPEEERFTTHKEDNNISSLGDADFSPLAEKLDGWINETLIKANKESK